MYKIVKLFFKKIRFVNKILILFGILSFFNFSNNSKEIRI